MFTSLIYSFSNEGANSSVI